MRRRLCLTFLLLPIFAALAPVPSRAADAGGLDFSGSFTLSGPKSLFKAGKTSPWVLDVAQRDTELEVTKTIEGKATTNRFMLDGSKAPYVSEGGAQGTSTTGWKGKTLLIDIHIVSRPQRGGPEVAMHIRERWTLSSDRNTITIRHDVDFPNSGLGGFQVIEPWSEVYTRNRP